VRSLSVDSLLWNPPEVASIQAITDFFSDKELHESLDGWDLTSDRRASFERARRRSLALHAWLPGRLKDGEDWMLGLALGPKAPKSIRREQGKPVFEVHSVRPCRRIGPDGQQRMDAVIEIVQRRKGFFDRDLQKQVDTGATGYEDAAPDFYYRGGCTLLVDPKTGVIRYCVRKRIDNDARLEQERRYRSGDFGDTTGGYFGPDNPDGGNPFDFLHGSY
jgi:hypothetical protein